MAISKSTEYSTSPSQLIKDARGVFYRDTVKQLEDIPASEITDGTMVQVQGVEYKWEGGAQVWTNVSGAITPEAWGLSASGDETSDLLAFCQYASDKGLEIKWDGRQYEFSKMELIGSHHWSGSGTLYSNKTVRDGTGFQSDVAVQFSSPEVEEIALTADFFDGDQTITLADTTNVEAGDVLHLTTTRLIDTDDRGLWHEGQMVKVREVSGNVVTLEDPLVYTGKAAQVTSGTVVSRVSDYQLEISDMPPGLARDQRLRLNITSGDDAGDFRYIIAIGGNVVRHSGQNPDEWQRDPWPAGVVAGVTYDYVWETVARLHKAEKVKIEGCLLFTRDRVEDATPGDNSFRGVRFEGLAGVDATFNISNFAQTNVHLSKCYRPWFHDSVNTDANLTINSGGTGYGVSVETCHEPLIENVCGARNRRTVDFSGAGGYTTSGVCRNVSNRGGGTNYAGLPLWPHGDERLSVCGSHGSGRFSSYQDCVGYDVYSGLVIRGRQEEINNFRLYGYANRGVNINYAAGTKLDGFYYSDRFSEVERGEPGRQGITDMPEKRLEQVIYKSFSQPSVLEGNLTDVYSNVYAESVSRCGIFFFAGAAEVIQNIKATNWTLLCSNEGTSWSDFRFATSGGNASIRDCEFANIRIKGDFAGYPGSVGYLPIIDPGHNVTWDCEPGGWVRFEDTYYARILDTEIARLIYGPNNNNLVVDFFNARTGDRPRGYSMHLESLSSVDRNPLSPGNKTGVDILAIYPTDASSGATTGNFGINLNSSAGFLSLVNNTGIDQTILVRMT